MASTSRKQPAAHGPSAQTVGRFELRGELSSGELYIRHVGRGAGPDGSPKLAAVLQLAPALTSNRTIASAVAGGSRALLRVKHPNVLGTLEVVERSSGLYVVHEYTEGLTLAELLATLRAKGEQIPLDIALRVLVDLLHGLHAVHETPDVQGRKGAILHGAVSADAVVVCVDGVARVRDFALARAARRYLPKPSLACLVGVSPEELAGESVDRRADIFGAAALAWQCMTGRPLVDSTDENVFAAEIGHAKFDPPSKHNVFVPRPCDDVIMRGLERDPARRWPTAAEMADALAAAAVVATPGRLGKWVGRVGANELLDRAKKIASHSATEAQPEPASVTPIAAAAAEPVTSTDAATPQADARAMPAGAVPARPPPAVAAPSAPEVSAQSAAEVAPRKPSIVVEDESPTIGMVTRGSEGAKNFQAATTQLLRAPSNGDKRGKPVAAAPKVALNLDAPPTPAAEPAVTVGGPPAAAALVAPDELPTLQGDRSGAELLASAARVVPPAAAPASSPALPMAAPPPSQPMPAAPIPAAPPVAAAPAFVEPPTVPREPFDDLPTVDASRGVPSFDPDLEPVAPAGVPSAGKSKVSVWIGAAAVIGILGAGAWWLVGRGSGEPTSESSSAPSGAATEQTAAKDANPATSSGAEASAETANAADTAAADDGATSAPDKVARSARTQASAEPATTAAIDTPAEPSEEPPTAVPPPRVTSTGAKPKPSSKPKSEDDLFSRK